MSAGEGGAPGKQIAVAVLRSPRRQSRGRSAAAPPLRRRRSHDAPTFFLRRSSVEDRGGSEALAQIDALPNAVTAARHTPSGQRSAQGGLRQACRRDERSPLRCSELWRWGSGEAQASRIAALQLSPAGGAAGLFSGPGEEPRGVRE